MKTVVGGITWAASEHFFVIPVAVVVLVGLFLYYKNYEKLIALLAAPQWRSLLIVGYARYKKITKVLLLGVAIIACVAALLRPQWGEKEEKVEQEGRDLFIGLDISRSMLATDVQPTRLAFAKAKIKQLVHMLAAERVGLLVFAGDALVQCPLTRDTAAFNLFLDSIDVETISSGTTAIDQALRKIVTIFSELPTRKNKLVVLFTDGEDFSTDLSSIKKQAQEEGIHIFMYGVGTSEGAPVPVINNEGVVTGHQKDESGAIVFSRLNTGILQALARESGGVYIAPTQKNEDLQTLVNYVERYEKEKFEDREIHTQEERYYYFLGVAFLCLLVEWLL